MSINKDLVKKYLQLKSFNLEYDHLIDEVYAEVKAISQVKKLCVVSEAKKANGYYQLSKSGLQLLSEDINNLFIECDIIATLVVTLGIAVDRKIAFYSKTDMTKSLVMDAVASVYVEDIIEELDKEIESNYPNKYRTMRFSAGYGDLDISIQKQVVEMVGADKYAGISVSESYLMTPMKSITAFIGFSDKKQPFSNMCLNCPQYGKCEIKCARAKN